MDIAEIPYKRTSETLVISKFIETIPSQNRAEVIRKASEKRESYTNKVWLDERARLSNGMLESNNLTPDISGWNKYLNTIYTQQSSSQKSKFGPQEWSVKYFTEMLSALEDNASSVRQFGRPKFNKSFYEYFQNFGMFSMPVSQGVFRPIEQGSLLVHSISAKSLEEVIESGVVGRGGIAGCAMSQDRIVYDDGFVIIFQAKDLVAAGYPLIQVNEDARDSEVLKEWRTPMPVDVSLARLVANTDDIPGRRSSQAEIATSYFGEDYLVKIPRL